MPKTSMYALNADNTIFVLNPGATSFTRLVRVTQANGNLIGLDFRPADGLLYTVTDTGSIYTINLSSTNLGAVTLVSNITVNGAATRFPSGYQSLMDFNPVLSAIRLIGGDTLNYAVVNSGGNLNVSAIQTNLTYGPNDVNKGVVPKVAAGSYTNNVAGATVTIFYGIDYDLDTFVTIAPATQGGSSATGGGVVQTIGRLVTPTGAPVNVAPTADFDIYSDANGGNFLVGVSGRTLFTIDLAQINPSLAPGTTQKVIAKGITMPDAGGGFVDVAVATAPAAPAPAPTPTPTPTPTPAPSPATYEAERGLLGGGARVDTVHPGFTGTGFVDYADNVAGSFVEFLIKQTGTRTLVFRYGNGSTVNRPCNVIVNGVSVGTLSFPPTGAWPTYRTVSLRVNLGANTGARVRVTATTAAGGPNLDNLTLQ